MVVSKLTKTKQDELKTSFADQPADEVTHYFLVGYFVVGCALSVFYKTWLIGLGVGSLNLLAYYGTRLLLPKSRLYQFVLSACFGIFMAQFIYQMHGLFEMHFFAFIGSALLITHKDWRLQLPIATVVVVHHAVFGYLQYKGIGEIYFTQVDYMTLQTFVIHVSLSICIFFISGLWAHKFHISTQQLEERNQNLIAGISSAKRIQLGLLCRESHLKGVFPKSFLLSMPADVVSGDFFWCFEKENKKFLLVAASKGMGVSGALISIISHNLINDIVINEHIDNPTEILELLDARLRISMRSTGERGSEGLDLALVVVDTYFKDIYFAGANRPLFLTQTSGFIETVPSNGPRLGTGSGGNARFETVRLSYFPGQRLYLSSNGICTDTSRKKDRNQPVINFESLQKYTVDIQDEFLKSSIKNFRRQNGAATDVMVVGVEL